MKTLVRACPLDEGGALEQMFDALLAACERSLALGLIDAILLHPAGIGLARKLAEKLSSHFSYLDDPEILLRSARIDIVDGDVSAAAARLRKAVLTPNDWQPAAVQLKTLAPALADRLPVSEVRQALEALAFRYASDNDVQSQLAACYRRLFAENLEEMRCVAEAASGREDLGVEAAALTVLLEAAPADPEIQVRIVQVQINLNNWDAVLQLCDRVSPQLAVEAMLLCAVEATKAGANDQAASFLERLLCLDPAVSFFETAPAINEALIQALLESRGAELAVAGGSAMVEIAALRAALPKVAESARADLLLRLIALLTATGSWSEARTELDRSKWPDQAATLLIRLDIALALRLGQTPDVNALVLRCRQHGSAALDEALSLLWQGRRRTEAVELIFAARDMDMSSLPAVKSIVEALAQEACNPVGIASDDSDLQEEFKANKQLCGLRAVLPRHPSILSWEYENHRRLLPAIMICGLPGSGAEDMAACLSSGLGKPLVSASSGLPLDHHLDGGAMRTLMARGGIMCAPCGATPSNLHEFSENLLTLTVVLGHGEDAGEKMWEDGWRAIAAADEFPVRVLLVDGAKAQSDPQAAALAVLDFSGIDRSLFRGG